MSDKDKIPEVSSLMWLANMFPWTNYPEDETDRMSNAIHLYCIAGAKKIEELSRKVDEGTKGEKMDCEERGDIE